MRPEPQRDPSADGALSACLVSLLDVDWEETPAAAGSATLERWQEWLAPLNLRVVPAAETPRAGFWIAAFAGRYVVMFGTPPGVVWDPAQGPLPATLPSTGLVLAALDPALPAATPPVVEVSAGTVEGVYVAEGEGAPCRSLAEAEAVAGRGLRGDRYFEGAGHFSAPGKTGQDLTLVEAEALEALEREHGVALAPEEARRNVLTRGIGLNDLVGRRFRVGEAECFGQRWCEPCAYLERLTEPGVLRGLVHRGGLRADVVTGGSIRPGDRVEAL